MPEYILIAGVNGAGKSALYHILDNLHDMPRINIDEIVRDFGDWRNPSDVMEAGKIAVRQLRQLLGHLSMFFSAKWQNFSMGKSLMPVLV